MFALWNLINQRNGMSKVLFKLPNVREVKEVLFNMCYEGKGLGNFLI